MNLFKRKQTTTTEAPAMPPELNDYYQAEKRQRAVVTWALGFATLAVTIAIAFGLFLGARWIVAKVRKNPVKTPDVTQNQPTTTEAPASADKPSSPTTNSGETPKTTPDTAKTTDKPKVSSATTSLPNTGPTETLAVFILATTAGVVFHSVVRKHTSRV